MEHLDILEHDHWYTSLFYAFLMTLSKKASLKTVNGVKAKIGTRTFYSNTFHLKGKSEVKGHAKVTLHSYGG